MTEGSPSQAPHRCDEFGHSYQNAITGTKLPHNGSSNGCLPRCVSECKLTVQNNHGKWSAFSHTFLLADDSKPHRRRGGLADGAYRAQPQHTGHSPRPRCLHLRTKTWKVLFSPATSIKQDAAVGCCIRSGVDPLWALCELQAGFRGRCVTAGRATGNNAPLPPAQHIVDLKTYLFSLSIHRFLRVTSTAEQKNRRIGRALTPCTASATESCHLTTTHNQEYWPLSLPLCLPRLVSSLAQTASLS